MTAAAPTPDDVLAKIDGLGPPGTPVTTPEVAEGFDCTKRTIYNRLDSLAEDGVLQTKKVGANSRVWWRPAHTQTRQIENATLEAGFTSNGDGQMSAIHADGEMAERIRNFEWADTPLGPMEQWPSELRVAVEIMLGADEAIGIYWGADLVLLYNDPAREQIGKKHPNALGHPARDVFPEAWETLGPIHEQVIAGDGPVRVEEKHLPLARDGELEDIWWDSSFNPIPAGDGSVGGVLNISFDVTGRVLTEQNLHETNERLEVVLNAAGMGTWEWDLDERTVRGDEEMVSLFDLPSSEVPVPVTRFLEKMSPEGVSQCERVMESTFEPGEEIQDEIRLDHVDDSPRWVTWRGRPAEDDPSVLRGVSFDSTEGKQAEIQRKERYRRLFESISEGFCIVEVLFDEGDEPVDYRFLETNPAFETLTGLSDAEGERMRALEPNHEEHWFETYGRVAKTGESEQFTNRAEHLDDRWYDVFAFPIGDPEERTVAILFNDITEQKEAEQKLRESEATLSAILDQLPLGVGVLNADGVYEMQNDRLAEILDGDLLPSRDPEKQAEWQATDENGDPIPPEEWPGARALRGETVTPGVEFRLERDGETRWFDVASVPFEEAGEEQRALGIVREITERKEREAREQFMRDLNGALRPLTDPTEVKQAASRLLGEHLDLDRAAYAELLADGETMAVDLDWTTFGVSSMTGEFSVVDFGWFFTESLRNGETAVIEDSMDEAELSEETYEDTWGTIGVRGAIAAPIVKGNRLVAAFYVHSQEPREWSNAEISLVETVAERTWEAVQRARAEAELKASNESFKRLNAATQELIEVDMEAIADRVTPLMRDVIDVEYASLWRYNETVGELANAATDAAEGVAVDADTLSTEVQDRIWQTFVGTDVDVEHGINIPTDRSSPLRSHAFVPLGPYGVVYLGSKGSETFDERTLDLLETTAASIETAWDRADGEEALHRQNEELTRLDRLNTLIREIDQTLVAADTREEIDDGVCERLANSDRFEFAWIGEHDPGTNTVEPRAWAGVDSGYLEDLSIPVEDTPTSRDPIARAVRTGELQVVADIATDSGFAPWREATLERGARSVICIPLVYDDTMYGVLTVYTDHPLSDDRNLDVLAELGNTIAHTINARETRATLQTDSVVELTLRFEECDSPLSRLAREAQCTIDYQGFVPRSDGQADVFFVVREASSAELQAIAEDILAFEEVRCLTQRADGSLFRARVSDPTLASRFTEAGAVVRSITIDAGVATAVVDIPHTAAVREFLDQLRKWYPALKLRARQSRERPLKTRQTFVAALDDCLTDRQREVLQTAYLSGFFEVPRVSTGQEVTALLGVSQPTFSEHLRTAQRKLCEVLFETDRADIPSDPIDAS